MMNVIIMRHQKRALFIEGKGSSDLSFSILAIIWLPLVVFQCHMSPCIIVQKIAFLSSQIWPDINDEFQIPQLQWGSLIMTSTIWPCHACSKKRALLLMKWKTQVKKKSTLCFHHYSWHMHVNKGEKRMENNNYFEVKQWTVIRESKIYNFYQNTLKRLNEIFELHGTN